MNDERISALEIALNNEMKEHEFYLKQAERSANPVGKAMFLQIAKEELEHHERLKQLHAKWEKEELWPESVPLEVAGSNLKTTLQNVIDESKSQQPGDAESMVPEIRISYQCCNLKRSPRDHYPKAFTGNQNP